MLTMLEENRRRDEQRDALIERLLRQLEGSNITTQNGGAFAAPQNYQVMPDLSKNIEKFSGNESSTRAREWLNNIESMCLLHRWPDHFALETARMHLIDGAADWYRSRKASLLTWSAFQIAFRGSFIHNDSATARWKRMAERTQQKNESIPQYFYNKEKLCQEVGLDFANTREQILIGLWSKDLYNAMSARNHLTMDQLIHDMIEHEHMTIQRTERARPTTATNTNLRNFDYEVKRGQQTHPSTMLTAQVQNQKGMHTENTNAKQEIRCYNCQSMGHYSRECTLPKRDPYCSLCKTSGHTQRYCVQKAPSSVNLVTGETTMAVNKYIKTASIDNINLGAFIDPGSAVCTIKASAMLNNELHMQYEPINLQGFGTQNHKTVSPGYVIAKITVDSATVEDVPLRVVPDDVQTTDIIIGRTFTEANNVVYLKQGDTLTFNEKLDKLSVDQPTSNEELQVTKKISIPPNSMHIIDVVLNHESLSLPVLNLDCEARSLSQERTIEGMTIDKPPVLPERVYYSPIAVEDLNVDQQQPKEVINELVSLLNNYRDCIALTLAELGRVKNIEFDIVEKPGSVPVTCKPYRTSNNERESIRKIVADWRNTGIVRDTNSPYASPVLLVRKKNGEERLVIDYRKLNAQTVKIPFPLPDIDDHLLEIGDNTLFITLDLAHGYLQVPIAEGSKHKTAFITPDETVECNYMMFGLTNAPAYFSKAMYKYIGPLRKHVILFYLDDIFIPGKNWEELREKLIFVLKALREAGLTLKLSKCQFLMRKVSYLGFEISGNGIEPGEQKVLAIKNFPAPSNVHEVRRYLGLSGFFRKFVPKYAEVASPLHKLLRANVPFSWAEVENNAFEKLKHALVSKPVLQPFSTKRYTELHTDASTRGLGGILLQRNEAGIMNLVYAISRRTSDVECNYHSSKLELLAIVWAVTRLRPMLINISFKIITDCQALVYLNTHRTKNAQIVRWHYLISEYDYEIEHREGSKLAHVDALSRAPVDKNVSIPAAQEALANNAKSVMSVGQYTENNNLNSNNINQCLFKIVSEEDEIVSFQFIDESIKRKMLILKKAENERKTTERGEIRDFILKNNILYKRVNDRLVYVAPSCMRKGLLVRFHDCNGHPGLDRTLDLMQRRYYFVNMRRYAKSHIRACFQCLATKSKRGRQAGELHPIPPGKRPFHTVHVDHVGPFISSSRRNKFILVLIDNLTKFVILWAMRNTKTNSVIKALEDFVCDFGAPAQIISDRGTCFTSTSFQTFCSVHGIKHILTSPRHAQANGQVERVNAVLVPMLQASIEREDCKDWDAYLKSVQRDLNELKNTATGRNPFESLYGYIASHNEGWLRTLLETDESYDNNHELRHKNLAERIIDQQKCMKTRYDKNRAKNIKFKEGDLVFVSANPTPTGDSTKLQAKNKGPFFVTEVLPSDTYKIANVKSNKLGQRFQTTAHVTQLQLWIPHRDIYDETNDQSNATSSEEENDGGTNT